MDNEIYFYLILTNSNYIEIFKQNLLKFGFVSNVIDKPSEAVDKIKTTGLNLIILDLDFSDDASGNFIEQLKTFQNRESIYILGTAMNISENILKKMQETNLISFLIKPLNEKIIYEKIKNILEKFKDHFPLRKHIRVRPDPDEQIRISFETADKKLLTTKLLDISLGGFACEMYSAYQGTALKNHEVIKNIVFMLNNKECSVNCEIINRKDTFIAFRFINFNGKSYETISKYVMKKVSV